MSLSEEGEHMRRSLAVMITCAAVLMSIVMSCEKLEPVAPAPDEVLDGPVEGLTYAQSAQHLRGDIAFLLLYSRDRT
jgi:hypothetical protein